MEGDEKEPKGALDAWILQEDEDMCVFKSLKCFKKLLHPFSDTPTPLKSCQSKLCGKIYRECLCHSSALETKLISNRTG